MQKKYDDYFYEELKGGSLSSARVIVPLVMDFTHAQSVIDIGCGIGTWLSVFKERGVKNITGVDGPWVSEDALLIPKESFTTKDVEKKFSINAKVDLAVCLEMAEHIPATQASTLVETLCSMAPVILFSAAIPFQGGVRHVNEQWPDYWAKYFAELGFIPVDCIRRRVWDDKRVSFFYAQNIFIYVSKKEIERFPRLVEEITAGFGTTPRLVHPHKYMYYAERWELIVPFLGKIPPSILHGAKRILAKLKHLRKK